MAELGPHRARKLTPDLAARILALVRAGHAPQGAARASGVGVTTWKGWLRAGRAGTDPEYARLVEDLEDAQEQSKAVLLSRLLQAAKDDWRASAWLLERRWPEEFGRRDQLVLEAASPAREVGEEDRARWRRVIEQAERTPCLPVAADGRRVLGAGGNPESRAESP